MAFLLSQVSQASTYTLQELNINFSFNYDIDNNNQLISNRPIEIITDDYDGLPDRYQFYGSNDIGQRAGYFLNDDGVTALVRNSDGTITKLKSLEQSTDPDAAAFDINNHGDVVGFSTNNPFATLWRDDQVFNLNDLVNLSSLGNWQLLIASGINDNGWIVGLMEDLKNGNTSVFLLTPDVTPSAVPLPAAVWLFGFALGGFGLLKRRKV